MLSFSFLKKVLWFLNEFAKKCFQSKPVQLQTCTATKLIIKNNYSDSWTTHFFFDKKTSTDALFTIKETYRTKKFSCNRNKNFQNPLFRSKWLGKINEIRLTIVMVWSTVTNKNFKDLNFNEANQNFTSRTEKKILKKNIRFQKLFGR